MMVIKRVGRPLEAKGRESKYKKKGVRKTKRGMGQKGVRGREDTKVPADSF